VLAFRSVDHRLNSLLLYLPSRSRCMLALIANAGIFRDCAWSFFRGSNSYIRKLWCGPTTSLIVGCGPRERIRKPRHILPHVLPLAARRSCALGVSFAISFGAAIPIEALVILQVWAKLAWHAALSRDLPLIVNVTLVVSLERWRPIRSPTLPGALRAERA